MWEDVNCSQNNLKKRVVAFTKTIAYCSPTVRLQTEKKIYITDSTLLRVLEEGN